MTTDTVVDAELPIGGEKAEATLLISTIGRDPIADGNPDPVDTRCQGHGQGLGRGLLLITSMGLGAVMTVVQDRHIVKHHSGTIMAAVRDRHIVKHHTGAATIAVRDRHIVKRDSGAVISAGRDHHIVKHHTGAVVLVVRDHDITICRSMILTTIHLLINLLAIDVLYPRERSKLYKNLDDGPIKPINR